MQDLYVDPSMTQNYLTGTLLDPVISAKGGIPKGANILIIGDPGTGKTTVAFNMGADIQIRYPGIKILVIEAEMNALETVPFAERFPKIVNLPILFVGSGIEGAAHTCQNLVTTLRRGLDLVIIDSIQTIASDELDSAAGSVSQVRECAAAFLRYAKTSGVPVILIGHINKEGTIAGPKVLEHIVDAVLQFEGDSHYMYRILRSIKNRFGSTSEMGIYEMRETGLREVTNPSEMLLSAMDQDLSGTAIGVTIDGARPFLIEVQALVSTAAYGTAQRSVTGFDQRRMNMLLAVLEKRVGFKLAQKDVFLNIAGGLKVNDPALDLAVICAILSSNVDIAIQQGVCFSAEVGLSGELRQITRIEQRIAEAEKLGFNTMIIPRNNLKGISTKDFKIKIVEASKVEDAFQYLFG